MSQQRHTVITDRPRHTPFWPGKTATLLLLSLMVCGALVPVYAQETALSLDLIDARIARLNQQGTGDAGVVQQYEEVRRRLNEVAAMDREAVLYSDALTSAPRLEAEIQQRLDTLDAAYDATAEAAAIADDQLRQRLISVRAERDALNKEIAAMDRVLAARESNTAGIRSRLAEIDAQLKTSNVALRVDPSAEPSGAEAAAWLDLADHMLLVAQARTLSAELDSQPVRLNTMLAQRAELALKIDRASALITILNQRVLNLPGHLVRSVDLGIDAGDPLNAVAGRLLEDHAELDQQRAKLNVSLTEAQQQQDLLSTRARTLEERFTTSKRIVEYGGDSEVLGRVLYTYWVQIDEIAMSDATGAKVRDAGTIVIQRVEHENALAGLVSAGAYVDKLLLEAGIEASTLTSASRLQLIDLARAYREDLREVINLESRYLDSLADLQSRREALDSDIAQYSDYMERLLLWIPNHPPLWAVTWAAIDDELNVIADQIGDIQVSFTGLALFALLTAILLMLSRQRLRTFQHSMNQLVARPRSDSIRYTLIALVIVAARVLPASLAVLVIALSLSTGQGSADLGGMLLVPAGLLFLFSFMHAVGERDGVGREHFGWQDVTMDGMRRELSVLTRWWLPLAVLAGLANVLTPGLGEEAIGRLTTLVALVIVAVYFVYDIGRQMKAAGLAWFLSISNRVRIGFVLILGLLLFTTLSGRMFTVGVLFQCVILTAWAGIGLLLIHAVLMRWLSVVRRRLRFNELMELRLTQSSAEPPTMEEGARLEESAPGLGEISNDTRQLVNLLTMVAGVAMVLLIWAPLLPALGTLTEIQLWSTNTEIDGEMVLTQITLATLMIVLALGLVTILAARRLPALLEMVLRSRTTISSGASYTISTLLNYLIISGGIIAALATLGLQWNQLQWLVAALGVGIGFGLQEIVANFISGLIILFERPIRIGDVVTVGDKDGTVTKIRIRATTIRDWDGKELLVPNKEFITGRLLNWSLSDSQTRLVIPVGIAYGSDVEKALNLLREIVISHPHTLEDPEPLIVFEHFGDNALELSARCFLDSLEHRLRTMTELRTAINAAFAEAGIVIAYPQRDIHLDTTAPLRVTLEGPASA